MRELNRNCVYSLEDLTSEEFKVLNEYLTNNKEAKWKSMTFNDLKNESYYILYWYNYQGWCLSSVTNKEITNAKELFYTLENTQVDCRGLSEEQIKEMADVFESNGYINSIGLNVCDTYFLLRQRWGKEDRNFGVLGDHKDDRFITITYEKFMELFAEKENEILDEKANVKKYIDYNKNNIAKELIEKGYLAELTIEKPKHYSKGIDTFARMEANCTKEECLAFAKGNIDKYNWREKGQDLEDYKKIISYANWAIKLLKDEK